MKPEFLDYYDRELRYIQELAFEFGKDFPNLAPHLGLDRPACDDPYVERLLEGFAFLTARVQLRIDEEFPRFTQHLLELVYPDYLAPTPSMAIVQFKPDLTEGTLETGNTVPRESQLQSSFMEGVTTRCLFRTAHEVTLWPLELTQADYISPVNEKDAPDVKGHIAAGIRLRLKTTTGAPFSKLTLDRLPLYLTGEAPLPMRLYESLFSKAVAVVLQPSARETGWRRVLTPACIQRLGFEDDEALLPKSPRSFQGYRLLREYFAFPQRFLFVEFSGLRKALQHCAESEIDIIVYFSRSDSYLSEEKISHSHFRLFCTPVINLFQKRADNIDLSDKRAELRIVPDKHRPFDHEVYRVLDVVGRGRKEDPETRFLPFYSSNDFIDGEGRAYYALHRMPRVKSSKERQEEEQKFIRSKIQYLGSELYLSLVDAKNVPYDHTLRELMIDLLCTNRDLPHRIKESGGKLSFTTKSGLKAELLVGPTMPKPSYETGETSWRLVSHLSLNYLSLINREGDQGSTALRDLLRLYSEKGNASIRNQIDGIQSVASRPVMRSIFTSGQRALARGLEVKVVFNETAYVGFGFFLLGAVLDRFFAKYVSLNSFTETLICMQKTQSDEIEEVVRWPVRIGQRKLL
ncbi:MAG: type VI secretion system baseplate subunit TssF [Planctomycetota bacterium]